jgi:hypothetical protein
MALTLRLILPECRLHLKAPITTAGAYSKYPKDTALQGVQQSQPIRILGQSWSSLKIILIV